MQKMIPLDQLKFGHEADPPINARKAGRDDDVAELAASIDNHGLGQALNVRDIKGQIYVADGNRRLAAIKAAAGAVVPAINLTTQRTDDPAMKRKDVAALLTALEPASIQQALLKRFDPKDYFGRASKPFVITAIAEAINADEARKAEKLKKAELDKFALVNVPKTGWLPPELRTVHYTGPGAKTAKAAKPAPAKKTAKVKEAA
jgi:hypothetical protein